MPAQQIRTLAVNGSERTVLRGAATTRAASVDCPDYWFSGDSTTILGACDRAAEVGSGHTEVEWVLPIDAHTAIHADSGHLVVGSRRYFGGLHSARKGARVDIWLNDRRIDGFGLFVQPEHHRDYFHRVPSMGVVSVPPFADCETVYAWPVRSEHLHGASSHRLRIRLDEDARWDIDHIGLQLRIREPAHMLFLSHAWEDKPVARQLAAGLSTLGVGVWLDEAEMKVGDSLIQRIADALGGVEYVAALLSPASVASSWVQKELSLAMQDEVAGRRVKVLPILLSPSVAVPPLLRDKLYLECFTAADVPRIVTTLARRVLPEGDPRA
ncbi:MAG TPA: toll/interleukin-1 receptor domain-containing protein [Gemmatimonadaceae bacterium]|nr:toll/interleukin-1 receptor domain-containing protein [Gemmatimonadaceae bacterium]